jgi:hypothetical protein
LGGRRLRPACADTTVFIKSNTEGLYYESLAIDPNGNPYVLWLSTSYLGWYDCADVDCTSNGWFESSNPVAHDDEHDDENFRTPHLAFGPEGLRLLFFSTTSNELILRGDIDVY